MGGARLRRKLAVFGIAAMAAACGDNLEPKQDIDTAVVLALDTTAPTQVKAGDTISITCTLLEADITTVVPATVRIVAEDNVMRMGKSVIARKAGTIEVTCELPDRGLVDPTPAIVQIVHGAAANVVTTVTPDPVVAGNDVTATCVVYDAYGNEIDDSADVPTLSVTPIDAGNMVTGLDAYMTRAGHYTARCDVPGTTSNNAGFDVIPNLPASIVLARWPDLPVYALGSIVDITHLVTDRFGNEITDPAVTRTMTPLVGTGPAVNVLAGQWRFDGEGTFRITHTVDPPTDGGVTLSAYVDIVVNSRGPAISCNNDASLVVISAGAAYNVIGNANDANGVASLTVNGNPVTVAQDGSWTYQIITRFGMNFVDITAVDGFGEPTTKVCTFLMANRLSAAASPIPDTVSLKLTQPAIDDNFRFDGLDSLDDVLYAIINSAGLSNTLHQALLNANPLKPSSCDSQTCTFLGCICWFRSEVIYLDRDLPGPNDVSLSLVSGGVQASVYIPDPSIKLRVRGNVSGIPYDSTGWATFDYATVSLILDTSIDGAGRPNISVRPGSVNADVGGVSTNFNGVDGWIIDNILVPLLQNQIRSMVRDIIRDFVSNNFNAALDGIVSSLDISTLGTTFNVPKLDGTGNIPMQFGLSFSSLATSSARMLFGIGTRFTTSPAFATNITQVALPPSPAVLLDPSVSAPSNTAVAAHVGVLNHALYALWRANFFAATLSASSIPGLPSGVSFVINTRLPPVAYITGTQANLHIGAMDLTVTHPSLPPNLSITLGAEAHTTVNLVGNDLVFGGIVIDTLHVSTDAVNLSSQQQTDLQSVLQTFLQDLVDESLNDSLPAIPIPSFTLPASLAQFGLPSGAKLGIVSPSLTVAPNHFTLRGQFGVQ